MLRLVSQMRHSGKEFRICIQGIARMCQLNECGAALRPLKLGKIVGGQSNVGNLPIIFFRIRDKKMHHLRFDMGG
jgi:hypothetical protein